MDIEVKPGLQAAGARYPRIFVQVANPVFVANSVHK